jgi:hypothetical protein
MSKKFGKSEEEMIEDDKAGHGSGKRKKKGRKKHGRKMRGRE